EYSVNLELLNLEKQNYNALENDYRNNRASYLDLILSINAYIDARSKYLAAYYDLRRQKMTYDFHSGLLYQHLT
ncbi:TolC family protein, partial [Vibrio parahaemolyticus]